MEQFPGLLETLDLKGVKPGRMNPVTGLLNEVVNPPALNQPDPNIIMGPERVKNFQNWFQGSQSLDPFGRPLTLYHGTTHDFDAFNPNIGSKDNWYGSAIYLTSSPDDAAANYLASGPDLTGRIERRAEEIVQDIVMETGESPSKEEYEKEILPQAKEELLGPAERIIPVHAALKNPVYINDTPRSKATIIDFKEMFGVDDAPDYEKYDDEDEYQEALDEWYATEFDSMAEKINEKIETAFFESYEGGQNNDDALYDWEDFKLRTLPTLMDRILGDDGYVKAKDIDDIIREDFNSDYGNSGEVIKNIFKELGYDGIIMDASKHFPRMESIDDAMHHIIFDPTKVKGMFNRGTYDPNNPDLLSGVRSGSGLLSV